MKAAAVRLCYEHQQLSQLPQRCSEPVLYSSVDKVQRLEGWMGAGHHGVSAGGGTPPNQLGGMGERCTLPHGGLRPCPKSQSFLRRKKTPKTMQKLN